MRSTEIGCCRIWVRDDPDPFLLHPRHYDKLLAAWTHGETFFTGKDCYDDEITLKLGAVTAIALATPANMAAAEADARADNLTRESE